SSDFLAAHVAPSAPSIGSPKITTLPPKPANTTVPTKHEPPVTIGSLKYRKAPPSDEQLAQQLLSVREFGLDRPLDDPLMQELIKNVRGNQEDGRTFHPLAMALDGVHDLPLR